MKKNINKKKSKCIRIVAVILIFALMLTGCEKKNYEKTPILLEPSVINSSYRQVEKGDIGNINVGFGTVVPTSYCHFYSTNTSMSKINVDVGDYVEEGKVLAYANVEAANEQIEDLKNSVALIENEFIYMCKLNDEQISMLEFKKKAYQEAGDQTGVEDIDKEIASIKENKSYDKLLKEYKVSKLNEKIKEQNEIVTDGTLKARHSGYVTFVKDLSVGCDAEIAENIVIISDENDLYIEMKDTTVETYKYNNFKVKYTKIAGVAYDIEEFRYSQNELILAKSVGSYPMQRFKASANMKLVIGETLPLYFCSGDTRNVLVIGNDSIFSEGDQKFVYVKTKTSDKERRNIKIGEADNNYSEVIEGLSEGELIYYDSDALVPTSYDKYTVELSDYKTESVTKAYKNMNAIYYPYMSEYEGTIQKINIKNGDTVKKGDVLLTIDTGGGKAALTEASNSIAKENEAYNAQIKDFDTQISEKYKQLSEYGIMEVPVATDTDAMKDYLYKDEQLKCEINVLANQKTIAELQHNSKLSELNKQYNKLNKNSNGSGVISILAEFDGSISGLSVKEKAKVESGTVLFTEGQASSEKILVTMVPITGFVGNNLRRADLGQTISFSCKNGTKYTGKCIGMTADEGRFYASTINDKAYITKSKIGDNKNPQFYVSMDDDLFYDKLDANQVIFNDTFLSDVVLLDKKMVYTEKSKENQSDYFYVWKIIDDSIVKQYVVIDKKMISDGKYVVLSGLDEGDVLVQEYKAGKEKAE